MTDNITANEAIINAYDPATKTLKTSGTVGVTEPVSVDDNGATLSVDDGGAAISVDDNGSTLSIDDGGGVITVDGAVTANVPASELHIGEVGGKLATVQVTPALPTAGAYIAGDYVGANGVAAVFTDAVRLSGGTGLIVSAELIDFALQSKTCELWLFDTAVTPPADNAAWTLSDAHAATLIGIINFDTYYASAANSVSMASNLGIGFKAVGSANIYGCIVTRGAPTYATGDVTIRLNILQD